MLKRIKQEIIWRLPHKFVHSIYYYLGHGKRINWQNPVTYDEKIQWLIVNRLNASYSKYADKYEVREYVKQCGFEDLLIPLIGVWSHVEQINFAELEYPNVMKLTHASGTDFYHIMHSPKDADTVIAKMRIGEKIDYGKKNCEYHYHNIVPRIMCEKFLGDANTKLTDYKVVCSKGKAYFILVCQNRDEGRDYYTTDWVHTEFTKKEYQSGKILNPPIGLDIMLRAAEKLSEPFELARVDFYDINGKIYFGEITLTPSTGNHIYLTKEGQKILGSYINIDF